MANSIYEYVKSFEVEDKIMLPTMIVVAIDGGHNFQRLTKDYDFVMPRDRMALDLLKSCAIAVMEKFADVIFSYGFSDEFSFILKKESNFHHRRESKILSELVSFFTSVFAIKWKDFFPQKLQFAPSFRARVVRCQTLEVLQSYLAWRQRDCHLNFLYDTCFYKLLEKKGISEIEAHTILKGMQKVHKHNLLFKEFGINYNNCSQMFRQGTCLFMTKDLEGVKHMANGDLIKRSRKKMIEIHSIINKSFWNQYPSLILEFDRFEEDIHHQRPKYIESFLYQEKLMLSTWIIVRIDGCNFHRFSKIHKFSKPNDIQALNLMNSCGVAVLEEFPDIVFGYGVSDEFSFVLRKTPIFMVDIEVN